MAFTAAVQTLVWFSDSYFAMEGGAEREMGDESQKGDKTGTSVDHWL